AEVLRRRRIDARRRDDDALHVAGGRRRGEGGASEGRREQRNGRDGAERQGCLVTLGDSAHFSDWTCPVNVFWATRRRVPRYLCMRILVGCALGWMAGILAQGGLGGPTLAWAAAWIVAAAAALLLGRRPALFLAALAGGAVAASIQRPAVPGQRGAL